MAPKLLATCAILAAVCACAGDAEKKPQRIVVITVDTLRHDCFASSERDEPLMPQTLRFARRGLVFDHFYATAASTQPTHASLFTGLHPWQHGVVRNGCVLSPEHETIVEKLKARGFATGAVVSSFPVHSKFGLAQGFDAYDDDFTFERKKIKDEWLGVETTGEYFYSVSSDITDKALATLDKLGEADDASQFLWVHYFDPHDPYGDFEEIPSVYFRLRILARNKSPLLGPTIKRARALYEKDVRRLDGQLGRLFLRLIEDEEKFETHVIFTSDHGESFGERGGPFGHGHHLIEEQLHVPTFLVSPRVSAGRATDTAGTVDLAATILALANDPRPSPCGRDLTAAAKPGERFGAFGMRSTFDDEVKVTQADGRDLRVDTPRFYAVRGGHIWSGDESEIFEADETPVSVPGFADELKEIFAGFRATLDRTRTFELDDPETRATLKALGYTE